MTDIPSIPEDFHGRTVLVTGASRGIAAAISKALGKAGASVILHYSAAADEAAGLNGAAEMLANEISSMGGAARCIDVDLAGPRAGSELAAAAEKAFGHIDSVVLSASRQINKPFLEQTASDLEQQFFINLHANVEILQQLLPPMAHAGFGRILTIGSVQEKAPSPEMPIYAMCKAALRNLVENLSLQFGAHGVTLNNLAPGLIETDRNAFRRADMASWKRIASSANPMGRAGVPEELAGAALYFLSRGASFVTGATLYATGGAHIPHKAAAGYPGLVNPNAKPHAAE